ncbi:MAG: hypothetical protein AAF512_25360, partial [Pseudomonadota bacterium]
KDIGSIKKDGKRIVILSRAGWPSAKNPTPFFISNRGSSSFTQNDGQSFCDFHARLMEVEIQLIFGTVLMH